MIKHRHLNSDAGWSYAAIDSVLERGSLPEWREMFGAARQDHALASRILEVARRHPMPGVLPIAERILLLAGPDLSVAQ